MRTVAVATLALALLACSNAAKPAAPAPAVDAAPAAPLARPLKIGVTLHAYYSWTAHVVAGLPGVEVVAVLPEGADAATYQATPEDIAKIAALDVIVINGIGGDDFIAAMIKASGNTRLLTITVNDETTLQKRTGSEQPRAHTELSFSNAIQQAGLIARRLVDVRPEYGDALVKNAGAYGGQLRAIQAATATRLEAAKLRRVAAAHDGYAYLLADFGIELAGTLDEQADALPALLKKQQVQVVLSDASAPAAPLEQLVKATGARVYPIATLAVGAYSADAFAQAMQQNADTLVQALVTDAK